MENEIKHRNSPVAKSPESNLHPRVLNLAKELSGLAEGKYVITLTLRGATAFYTVSPMSEVKH